MSKTIPREEGIDHTFSMLREGYMYILNRRQGFNSDIFETRLFGKKVICMGGKEAAEVFYDPEKFKREGSAPRRLIQTLFGKNAVQTLDGEIHNHRKAMFMSLMSPGKIEQLKKIVRDQWNSATGEWEQKKQIIFYEEVQKILCRSACEWAGILISKGEIKNLTNDLRAMYESPAALGPNHWQGRVARIRIEKWIQDLVHKVRDRQIHPSENTALHKFSWERDLNGELLDPKAVSVEVINIIRPIVAISIYINFLLLALHHFPEERTKLIEKGEPYAAMFIQEVRRYYPFFPFLVARVRKNFMWKDYMFKKNTLTFLDLYGTNHDPNLWDNPNIFHPERFTDLNESLFSLIPQGGGEYLKGHRCAGEKITIEVMHESLNFLLNRIDYNVPEQDLSYSLVKIPSIPKSKIILENIKKKL